MQQFTDTAGDTWQLVVTFGDVQQVEKITGLNLPALLDDDMAVFVKLSGDYGKLIEVLAVLLEDQVDAKGLDANQFARRFGGDVLGEAFEALVQAVIDFFPNEKRREVMRGLVKKIANLTDKMIATAGPSLLDKIDRQVQSADFEKLFDGELSSGRASQD